MENKIKLKTIESSSVDPWYNLALEEKLFYEVKNDEVILYLWQNKKTVVIGRNQNPWRECRYKELEADGGKLARRLSGGGAVYHDLGNLNFTFIMKKKLFNIEKQLQIIINAVYGVGINAEFTGRNDIVVDGKKFSGNAFYYDGDRCYHHGTLLVSADISKLSQYLKVSKEKMESKGIKSVRSRVTNLENIKPGLMIKELKFSLEKSFEEAYNCDVSLKNIISTDIEKNNLKNKYEKNASWEWRYGQTPNFKIKLYRRFKFGDVEILINLKDSYINEIEIYSDAMDANLALDIKKLLYGEKFTGSNMANKIIVLNNQYDGTIIYEIEEWLRDI
jgi:lipoate-protein ligase A